MHWRFRLRNTGRAVTGWMMNSSATRPSSSWSWWCRWWRCCAPHLPIFIITTARPRFSSSTQQQTMRIPGNASLQRSYCDCIRTLLMVITLFRRSSHLFFFFLLLFFFARFHKTHLYGSVPGGRLRSRVVPEALFSYYAPSGGGGGHRHRTQSNDEPCYTCIHHQTRNATWLAQHVRPPGQYCGKIYFGNNRTLDYDVLAHEPFQGCCCL